MVLWIIYAPLVFLSMVICYITNPLVVLFCNEVGELKGILHYWQTWDDSCDNRIMVMEKVPKVFRYDFDSKYSIISEMMTPENRIRYRVVLKENASFTVKERFKRYVCRWLWLQRNCAYGFAFRVFGVYCNPVNLKKIKTTTDTYGREAGFFRDTSKNILICPWAYYSDKIIYVGKTRYIEWNTYLGWKVFLKEKEKEIGEKCLCMIANRISFKIKKGKPNTNKE